MSVAVQVVNRGDQWRDRAPQWTLEDKVRALLAMDYCPRTRQTCPAPWDDSEVWNVGAFLSELRRRYRHGRLAPELVAILEANNHRWRWLGPEWTLEDKVRALVTLDYRPEPNDTVPAPWDNSEVWKVGAFLSKLRHHYRHGRLAPELVAILEANNHRWQWLDWSMEDRVRTLVAMDQRPAKTDTCPAPWGGVWRVGLFLHNLVLAHRRGRLSPNLVAMLDANNHRWQWRGWTMTDKVVHMFRLVHRPDRDTVMAAPWNERWAVGLFLDNIVQRHRRGRLAPELVALLDAHIHRWQWYML